MTIQDRPRLSAHRRHQEAEAQQAPQPFAGGARPSRARVIALGALALFLVFAILTRGVGAYLANTNPSAALYLRPTNPTALLNLADQAVGRDESFKTLPSIVAFPRADAGRSSSHAKGDESEQEANTPAAANVSADAPAPALTAAPDAASNAPAPPANPAAYAQIEAWAETALRNDPLSSRALRILGQIAERTADQDRTEAFMQAATRRSISENLAVYWMAGKSFQDKDYQAALRYADALARTTPRALPYVMPLFGRLAETPGANEGLKQLLAANPPWRTAFMEKFPRFVTDARTPLDILLSLKDTPAPPTADDLRRYLDFLINHKFYDLAYYTWLQFLAPEQLTKAGYLFNGDFERQPSNLPFDWTLTPLTGVTMAITEPQEDPKARALLVKFGPGRVDYRPIKQMIMLGAGTYVFRGRYKADLVSQRGLEWLLVCANKVDDPLGRGVLVRKSESGWSEFEIPFSVPAGTCPAQYVQLIFDARTESERFISGTIWFDDLQIARQAVEEAQPAPQSQPDVQPQQQPEAQPQAQQQQPPQPQAQPEAQAQPAQQQQAQPQSQPEPQAQVPQPQPPTQPEPQAQVPPQPEPQAQVPAEPQNESISEPLTLSVPQPQPLPETQTLPQPQ